MAVITAAVIGAVGAGVAAKGAHDTAKSQVAARDAAIKAANKRRRKLFEQIQNGNFQGEFNQEDVFGSSVDPLAALYRPVDINESQANGILGNQENLGIAASLSGSTNEYVTEQALQRISALFPGARDNIAQIGENTSALLRGELPPDVVSGIIRDTQSMGGQLGTPGTTGPNTLRHLGLNRLQAVQQGQSMFSSFVDLANRSISPLANQVTPQQSFLAPSERIRADLLQAELEQQGRLSSAVLAAQPDPAAAGIFNAELQSQLVAAGLTSAGSSGAGLQSLGNGLQSVSSSALQAYAANPQAFQTQRAQPQQTTAGGRPTV